MNKVRCADVTCSAVSSMSTSELHEPVYAPHRCWWWLSLVGEGQLPSFLDGGEAFVGMGTQVLQDDEAEQHQAHMADHCSVGVATDPLLTSVV